MPAATKGALTARRLWDSVTKIGRAPRPRRSARPSASMLTGPSVSPAGIHGDTPAPVAMITWSPGFTAARSFSAARSVSGRPLYLRRAAS